MKTLLSTIGATALVIISSFSATIYAGPGHKTGGGHMDHMNDVKHNLKRELGNKYNKTVPAATNEQLVRGKIIFTKSCVACHGESGKGDGAAAAALKNKPADFTDSEHSKFYSDQGRILIIKKGVKDTPMSGWESVLSEEEIHSVHAYIRSLRITNSSGKNEHSDHRH